MRGPLSRDEWIQLEPEADLMGGHVYFFEEEGCVDPCAAVQRIRDVSKSLGVEFISNQSMTMVLRDELGKVTGIKAQNRATGEEIKLQPAW